MNVAIVISAVTVVDEDDTAARELAKREVALYLSVEAKNDKTLQIDPQALKGQNHPADRMETDTRCVCPDPACRLFMRVDRIAQRRLKHDDVSPIPWAEVDKED